MKGLREQRMRGGEDEGKGISPMFPRVHVNDTEKEGPGAPPRNQVALDEQFGVPYQRHTPSFSSSHGVGHETNPFRQLHNDPSRSLLVGKLISSSDNGLKSNAAVGGHEGKMTEARNYLSYSAKGPFLSNSKSGSFLPYNLINFRNSSFKNLCSSDHNKVPNFSQSGADPCRQKLPNANLPFSPQLLSPGRKPVKETAGVDEKSRHYARKLCEEDATRSQSCLVDTSSNASSKVKNYESLKRPNPPINKELGNSSMEADNMAFRDNLSSKCTEGIRKKRASKLTSESCPRKNVGYNNGSLEPPETICGFEQITAVDRCDEVSDNSMMDSESALSKHHDDVVRIIGEKQFWKIRTAIINQEKIFARQVFELHRLIKVQKWMAGSPKSVLQDNLSAGKPIPAKNSSLPVLEIAQSVELNGPSHKPKPRTEFSDRHHLIPKLPLPSTSKELVIQNSDPLAMNEKLRPPWSFPAHRNQWLIPVMSPSEGLVYKPYTGPYPLASGSVAPVDGKDFSNTGFPFSVSHQLNHTFVPLFGMPVHNPSIPVVPVEHMDPFSQPQSPSSMLSHINLAVPRTIKKPQTSKDSELQGSSTSGSPQERPKVDVLPLFPTEPMHQTETKEQQQPLRAIKVVPHNPRSASKSAAMILRSIKEERNHYDYMIS